MLKNCLKMARKKTEGKYPIEIVDDVFAEGNATLADTLKAIAGTDAAKVALVADANVVQRTEGLGLKIGKYFKEHGITLAASPVVISGGEKIKADGLQSAMLVATSLVDARIGANDVVIALGGGTVLDVTGYVAAQVRGGLKLLRMPTTPAAMIDAAFADAAAVDGVAVKDALSVHCEPAAVVIDPTFTKTILDGVWCAGFGEAVRYAAVCDAALMKRLAKRAEAIKTRDFDAMRDTISDCVKSRAGAAFAPFAQWCAARLESMSGYKLPHGYAVAIAICIDCAYAVKKRLMDEDDQELVCRALADCGALDGLSHSHYLLANHESLMKGVDAWALMRGSEAIPLPGALGKSVEEKKPDRAAYAEVLEGLLAVSRGE